MERAAIVEHVHDLQVSLQDGDDLARAISLIGDALQRRMEAIRLGLEVLHEDGSEVQVERLTSIVDRVRLTLDRYESEIETRRKRMEELVDEFQESLGSRAAELAEVHQELGGPTSDGN